MCSSRSEVHAYITILCDNNIGVMGFSIYVCPLAYIFCIKKYMYKLYVQSCLKLGQIRLALNDEFKRLKSKSKWVEFILCYNFN